MSSRNIRQTCLVVTLLLSSCAASVRAQVGASGMPLLKNGATARDIGMGYVAALADGPAAVQGNPAGLQGINAPPMTRLLFTHQEWIQDARTEFLGASVPLGEHQTFGLSLLTQTVSDIEIRTQPGPPQGTFTSRDLAVGLSYAREFSGGLRIGVTGRFLYQKILVNEATGLSFDAGVRTPLPLANFEAGLTVMNLGSMTVLQNERTTLPALVRAGLGYSPLHGGQMTLRLEGDVVRILPESRFYAAIGGEFWFQNIVVLRVGNEFGSEGRGMGAGIGVQYGMFSLDYSYASLKEDLGSTHTFTLGLSL
jgi:hypothetical protein